MQFDSPLAERAAEQGWIKWAIAITVALGAILEVIDVSIVNVALPHMQGNLGATLSEIGWVITGYSMANVVIIPLTAWLDDRFGRKRYFIFSLVAFSLASMLCGLATSLPMLIFARVLQGLGGGSMLAKAQSILFQTFSKAEQGAAQAAFGLARHHGAGHRPDARRLPHRRAELALDFLHQHSRRHPRRPPGVDLPAARRTRSATRAQRRSTGSALSS